MRKIVTFFICAELLDVITTIIGLSMGLAELNPIAWEICLPLKLLVIVVVAIVLQRKTPRKIDLLIPIVAALPVIWNLLNICLMI